MRKKAIDNVFRGHDDTISGLALSNNGNFLLSNSMDQSIICW
jgi:Prp8 binding protein